MSRFSELKSIARFPPKSSDAIAKLWHKSGVRSGPVKIMEFAGVAAKNSVHIESIKVAGAKQTRKEESNNGSAK